MSKREQRRVIQVNRRKVFLKAWAEAKAGGGVSLSAFCRDHGLCRKNFYLWLKVEGQVSERTAIKKVDERLKLKAVEIYLRYKGTWSPETIALALGRRLSAWSIRKAIEPYRNSANRRAAGRIKEEKTAEPFRFPNLVWTTDWTEYKLKKEKVYIWVLMDEAARFHLSWEILDQVPTSRALTAALESALSRYEKAPLVLKSDRASVFRCEEWREALSRRGMTPKYSRPHCPQDQGSIERAIREVKTWILANAPGTRQELEACLREGMWMINFLKPKTVLGGKTPASVYFARTPIKEPNAQPVPARTNP